MQHAVPAVLMRGGTSKGLFLHERDVPVAGPARDGLLLRLLGSPDPMQIDGLGGTHSSTSKVVIVAPSDRPDCDVEYLFGQVAIDDAYVDYAGNCGNLTSAVGPFAIEEGLVQARDGTTVVRLLNRNTGKRIDAEIPTRDGVVEVTGSSAIAGVPGTGARIVTTYLDPGGAVLGAVLPTGRAVDHVPVPGLGQVTVSIVDVSHPYAFVTADQLAITAGATVAELNADVELLARLEAVRGACAVLLGRATDPSGAAAESPTVPRLVVVDGVDRSSETEVADIAVRMVSMGRVHHACPITGAVCTAAAATIPGTVVNTQFASGRDGPLRVRHPKGVTEASAVVREQHDEVVIDSVSVTRTARRLMAGVAYVPAGSWSTDNATGTASTGSAT